MDSARTKLAPLYIKLITVITDYHKFYSVVNPLKSKSIKNKNIISNIISNCSWERANLSSKRNN